MTTISPTLAFLGHGPALEAARLLGIKPTTLRSRLLKLGLMQTRTPRQPRRSRP